MASNIKLVIENFKGVLKAEIDLPRISILIGGNNSGKTTLLEALYLLNGPHSEAPYVVNNSIAKTLDVLNYLHAGSGMVDFSFLTYKYISDRVIIYSKIKDKEYNLRIYNTGIGLIFYTLLGDGTALPHCKAMNITGEITPPSLEPGRKAAT